MTTELYEITVASHLSHDWCAVDGMTGLTTSQDSAGRPTTELIVEVTDRAQLVQILCELHAANVAILAFVFVREPEPDGRVCN